MDISASQLIKLGPFSGGKGKCSSQAEALRGCAYTCSTSATMLMAQLQCFSFISAETFCHQKPQVWWFCGWHLQGQFGARPGHLPQCLCTSRSPHSHAHNPKPSTISAQVAIDDWHSLHSSNFWEAQLAGKTHGHTGFTADHTRALHKVPINH